MVERIIEKDMETVGDCYVYRITNEDEITRLVLELPKHPDNVGWVRVRLSDGRRYTLYGLDNMIEEYVEQHKNDDEVEADEDNEYIELKQELVKVVSSRVDSVTARNIVDELWGQFKIERPDC